jgi:putative endonuclease
MGTHYVYALSSVERNYIYKGMCADVIKRFHRHNNGFEKTTKPYKPFLLIYSEEFENRKLTREKEVYLKSPKGREELKK